MPEDKTGPPSTRSGRWDPVSQGDLSGWGEPRSAPTGGRLLDWAGGARVTLAVVFTDIVGSTLLRVRLKDQRMNEILRAHFAECDALVGLYGGYRGKTAGDGVMGVFASPGAALGVDLATLARTGHRALRVR